MIQLIIGMNARGTEKGLLAEPKHSARRRTSYMAMVTGWLPPRRARSALGYIAANSAICQLGYCKQVVDGSAPWKSAAWTG